MPLSLSASLVAIQPLKIIIKKKTVAYEALTTEVCKRYKMISEKMLNKASATVFVSI